MKINPLSRFVSEYASCPEEAWIKNTDLRYLYEQALQFDRGRRQYANQLLEIVSGRIGDTSEVEELKNHLETLVDQAAEKGEPEWDIYISQAIEVLVNDYWLLKEMREQGAGQGNIRLLKEDIVSDAIEVGKRLFRNAIRKVQALNKEQVRLDRSKVRPLMEWVQDGSFDVNQNLPIPAGVKRIHLIINAGRSTRVRTTIPKGVIYLGGKPLIQHTIDAGRAAGFEKTMVVLGFKKAVNEAFLEKDIITALQPSVEGTAHAVMSAYPALRDFEGTLLVSYSDMPFISGETLRSLLEKHESSDSIMAILTTSREKRPEFGRLVRDEQGNYLRIAQVRIEETESDQVDAGFYCFRCPDMWEYLGRARNENNRYEYYFTDIMDEITRSGQRIIGHETDNEIETFGINRPNELIKAFETGYHLYDRKRSLPDLTDCFKRYPGDFQEEVLKFYRKFSWPEAVAGPSARERIAQIEEALSRQVGAVFYC